MEVSERIGPYEILRELGRGGMAVVYLAREPDEGTLIALKVLPETWTTDPFRLKRFQREAATVMKVRHPNIVPVYSVGSASGVRFIAMKYIEGTSLDLLIRDQIMMAPVRDERIDLVPRPASAVGGARDPGARIGPPISWLGESPGETTGPPISLLSEPEWVHRAVVVVETIARALNHVHDQGIVHRDVKPGNIIIDRFGDAWLADFGLVRDLHVPGVSQTEGILGTVQYIAPEQIERDDKPADRRADLYALGVTLYELVTLKRPFDGDQPTSILRAAVLQAPVPPRRINPRLTHGFERVIQKAMARDPDARYQTGNAFAEDLRRLLTTRGAVASQALVYASPPRFAGRNLVLKGAVAFLVLLVLSLVGYCTHGAFGERQRLFECRAEADRAFDRGDYGAAADSYRLYVNLGGRDSGVLQRLRCCQEAVNLPAPK